MYLLRELFEFQDCSRKNQWPQGGTVTQALFGQCFARSAEGPNSVRPSRGLKSWGPLSRKRGGKGTPGVEKHERRVLCLEGLCMLSVCSIQLGREMLGQKIPKGSSNLASL